ncbi:MAG: 4-hydroxy-tetrahydrodipicolinate synthase [Ruminococcus sp.]|jgi:4-hydroxy-tetrahydrodipicolinate synthase|nr:4-hydroxy-tetrahydrodipicolinate synthase [Ruminococcus sp.]
MSLFKGAGVAIVTPMNEDKTINYEQFEKNIEFQIKNNIDAIIVCGTTGESSTLTDEEHIEVIRFCVDIVKKRKPVIAGTGSNDTAYATELSKSAEEVGADAVLLVTPYYNKTSQRGLVQHFKATAEAINIPTVLYNVPSRTGINIGIDTYKELAKCAKIVAVKEANGDISHIMKVMDAVGGSLDIYSGNDNIIVPMMSVGAVGVISVVANILPNETHNICEAALAGDFKKASDLQLKYLELMDNLFIETNPIPIKAAMNLLGMGAGSMRLPLVDAEDKTVAILKQNLKDLGIVNA